MSLKPLIFFASLLALALSSCSTKKNAFPNRVYHDLTARYNGYYYSTESIDDGEFKINKSHKDNFEKIIPVYVYPTPDKVKSTFPEFDKAIKKSSVCIQKHAIKDKKGNEIPTAGKWIDNNWINIGISQFYKREFFSAIETFEYVVRNYNKSDDKFTAMIWLTKAYNEIGSVSNAEPILSLLKNEKKLPRKIKNELPVVWADYYVRRGQYSEASAKLMEATRNTKFILGLPRKRRARYSFIIAQLLEQNKDPKRAIAYYKKTIQLKPNYEMVFYSKIKIARLFDVKRGSSEKVKKSLLKMSREFKNSDYYDVIFYTLGEIEEKEKNIPQALIYYKKSVQTSVSNSNQKALSYLKLGEINFDLTNYQPAEAYYDSTIVTLPKDHPEYNAILARKKTLETLVGYIKTISREDSLQRVAKMSEKDREAFIQKLIQDYDKEQLRLKKEKEAAALAAQTNTLGAGGLNNAPPPGFGGNSANWYFYNPSTVAFGITDFQRRWGNRKYEDNWRRSNKAAVLKDEEENKSDTTLAKRDSGYVPEKTKEFYLKNLPLNDSLLRKSNGRIVKAYYMMGSIYKEELNDTKKTIASFEELNTRFPKNKYLLNTYYILYRIYLDARNTPKADYYKEKILSEFPDSEFAALIKNPSFAQELSAQKSEVEAFYTEVYEAYAGANYNLSLQKSSEGIRKFGKSDFLPRFEFIKTMSNAKLRGTDSLEQQLKMIVAKYPKAEIVPMANDIIAAIERQKKALNPPSTPSLSPGQPAQQDTFQLSMESKHIVFAIVPDDPKVSDVFKNNLGFFNTVYYNSQKFDISSTLFGDKKQLVLIKSFADAKTAVSYFENLSDDQDVFKGDVKRELIEIFPISADNLPFFYKSKNVNGYKAFYEANYKNLSTRN